MPEGAEFLADAVADVGPEGAPAAVIVYRWPIEPPALDRPVRIDVLEPQLIVHPLEGAIYTPRQPRPDSPVRLLVADLNQDELRDAVTVPVRGGATIFANSGLLAWPRILSAADIQFYGGHLSLPGHDDRFFLEGQPVLYYAGRKEASFADVDRDGQIEVDIAYSLEDGADTWQVDRYRWDGTRYVYSETWSRPAAESCPAACYRALLEALAPLPDYTTRGIPPLTPQRVQVQTQELATYDLDGDGVAETLWTYLVRPFYGQEYERWMLLGDLWLSVLSDRDGLLWREHLPAMGDRCGLEAHARPVRLGAEAVGVVAYQLETSCGNSGYDEASIILYEWNERAFELPWRHVVGSRDSNTAASSRSMRETAWIQDIDGDRRVEVLLVDHIDQGMEHTSPHAVEPWTANYTFHMPGTLALSRSAERVIYQPAYWLQDARIVPIRPRGPIALAPRLSQPLSIDGRDSDWGQIEYAHWWGVRFGENEYYGFSPLPAVAWDEQMLYLKVDGYDEHTNGLVRVALDTDLVTDFDRRHLDGDDFVFEFAFSEVAAGEPVSGRVLRPWNTTLIIRAAAALHGNGTCCALEIAIPLDELGLDSSKLVPVPGWATGGEEPNARREYFPRAGHMMGLALDLGGETSSAAYRVDDPTAWNTLILIADR